jgi:threonine/homoserine/homoserine lactone efflux protein
MIINFLQGFTLAIAAALTPGPFQAFLLSQAVKSGWKRTLPAALSPLISDGPIIILVLFILTQTPQLLLDGLRIVGGLFILYLGRKAFLSIKKGDATIKPSPEAGRQNLFKAAVLNLLNPNPYIFWSLVAGPILLSSWRKAAGLGISFIAGFYITFICCLAVFILVFASAGRLNPRVNKILNTIASVALLAFGLYQNIFGLIVLVT